MQQKTYNRKLCSIPTAVFCVFLLIILWPMNSLCSFCVCSFAVNFIFKLFFNFAISVILQSLVCLKKTRHLSIHGLLPPHPLPLMASGSKHKHMVARGNHPCCHIDGSNGLMLNRDQPPFHLPGESCVQGGQTTTTTVHFVVQPHVQHRCKVRFV